MMLLGTYLGLLWLAFICWLGIALIGAPAYTGYFCWYIAFELLAEIWLNCVDPARRIPASESIPLPRITIHLPVPVRRCPRIYDALKITQRLAALFTIFWLIDGDFGRIIAIELALIFIFAIILRKSHSDEGEPRKIWRLLKVLDEGIAIFLVTSCCYLVYQHGWFFLFEPRVTLLAGLALHYGLILKRERLGQMPGSTLDKYNAFIRVAWWLATALLVFKS